MSLLKARTGELHQRVERAVDLPCRLQSIDSYADLLSRFYGLYAPLESQFAELADAASAHLELDLSTRRKVPWIERDLAALDWSSEQLATIPECDCLPAIEGDAELLGVLYVVEGSTLGGQIIRRMVEQQLGLTNDRGCMFFSGYGDQTGVMWKDFCTYTTAFAASDPGAMPVIIDSASKMFVTVQEWLT